MGFTLSCVLSVRGDRCVRQCQRCQKPSEHPFGTFVTPSVSVSGELHALLWERRSECPGAVSVLVGHDEVIVECNAERTVNARSWLEKAMTEGMDAIMNGTDEVAVPVEVEARIARSWGDGG
jgi:hypothetical protein